MQQIEANPLPVIFQKRGQKKEDKKQEEIEKNSLYLTEIEYAYGRWEKKNDYQTEHLAQSRL